MAATLNGAGPWSTSLQWRYLGAGALVDDDSLHSQPASTVNLRIARQLPALGRDSRLTLDLFNLFDRRNDDVQYAYASKLAGEPAAVFDRHVHPAEPRTVRLTLRLGH